MDACWRQNNGYGVQGYVVVVERKNEDLYICDEKKYCSECWDIGTDRELQWRVGDMTMEMWLKDSENQ